MILVQNNSQFLSRAVSKGKRETGEHAETALSQMVANGVWGSLGVSGGNSLNRKWMHEEGKESTEGRTEEEEKEKGRRAVTRRWKAWGREAVGADASQHRAREVLPEHCHTRLGWIRAQTKALLNPFVLLAWFYPALMQPGQWHHRNPPPAGVSESRLWPAD